MSWTASTDPSGLAAGAPKTTDVLLRKPRRVRTTPERAVSVQVMGTGFLDVLSARDISPRGVGIVVPHRFVGCGVDDGVDLVITLPGERPFLARGRIVHRTKTSEEFFGVEFTDIARYIATLPASG